MAVAFVSVLLFVVFQLCTCANLKMPPSFLETAQGKLIVSFLCVCYHGFGKSQILEICYTVILRQFGLQF